MKQTLLYRSHLPLVEHTQHSYQFGQRDGNDPLSVECTGFEKRNGRNGFESRSSRGSWYAAQSSQERDPRHLAVR